MEQTNIKKTVRKINRIFLIGFMCAGKTITGKLLAKNLKIKFKDSDAEIEKIYKRSPSVIIKEEGIAYFRKIEEKTVKDIMKKENIVIAMGGGIMALKKWNEYLKDKGLSVYLSCSAEELKKRLLKEENIRPLIGKGNPQKIGEKIKNLLEKRCSYYKKADFNISTTKLSPAKTAREIEKLIFYAKKS